MPHLKEAIVTRVVFVGVSIPNLEITGLPSRFTTRSTEVALAETKRNGCDVLIVASATCKSVAGSSSTLDNTRAFLDALQDAGRWPRLAVVITNADAELACFQRSEYPLQGYSAKDLERHPGELAAQVMKLVN